MVAVEFDEFSTPPVQRHPGSSFSPPSLQTNRDLRTVSPGTVDRTIEIVDDSQDDGTLVEDAGPQLRSSSPSILSDAAARVRSSIRGALKPIMRESAQDTTIETEVTELSESRMNDQSPIFSMSVSTNDIATPSAPFNISNKMEKHTETLIKQYEDKYNVSRQTAVMMALQQARDAQSILSLSRILQLSEISGFDPPLNFAFNSKQPTTIERTSHLRSCCSQRSRCADGTRRGTRRHLPVPLPPVPVQAQVPILPNLPSLPTKPARVKVKNRPGIDSDPVQRRRSPIATSRRSRS
jgi:hypothetical protein